MNVKCKKYQKKMQKLAQLTPVCAHSSHFFMKKFA